MLTSTELKTVLMTVLQPLEIQTWIGMDALIPTAMVILTQTLQEITDLYGHQPMVLMHSLANLLNGQTKMAIHTAIIAAESPLIHVQYSQAPQQLTDTVVLMEIQMASQTPMVVGLQPVVQMLVRLSLEHQRLTDLGVLTMMQMATLTQTLPEVMGLHGQWLMVLTHLPLIVHNGKTWILMDMEIIHRLLPQEIHVQGYKASQTQTDLAALIPTVMDIQILTPVGQL